MKSERTLSPLAAISKGRAGLQAHVDGLLRISAANGAVALRGRRDVEYRLFDGVDASYIVLYQNGEPLAAIRVARRDLLNARMAKSRIPFWGRVIIMEAENNVG